MAALREGRTATVFLKQEPGQATHNPVTIGEGESILIYVWIGSQWEQETQVQRECQEVSPCPIISGIPNNQIRASRC